ESVAAPGCLWTDGHAAQGFARRESTVCFGTLLEFGYADVAYEIGAFAPHGTYERAIGVPFLVATGRIVIDGPDERDVLRIAKVPSGSYRLVAAQRAFSDEEEAIDVFFERFEELPQRSIVIIADEQLNVPERLLETAD